MAPSVNDRANDKDIKVPELEPYKIYLIKEKKTKKTFEIMGNLVKQGYDCLGITRSHPERIVEQYGLPEVRFIWLTGNKVAHIDTLSPTEIGRLSSTLNKYITTTKDRNRGILIDNLEYLIMQNSFQTILRFIHMLRDKVMLFPVILIIPIDPLSIDFKELRLLERECEIIDMKDY